MLAQHHLFLAVLAAASTAATFTRMDDVTRTLTALFAMSAWALWAVHSFDVTTVSSGVEFTFSYVSLAALGLAAAAIMLLTAVRLAFGLIGAGQDTTRGFDPNAR